jgi:hypothetical protein
MPCVRRPALVGALDRGGGREQTGGRNSVRLVASEGAARGAARSSRRLGEWAAWGRRGLGRRAARMPRRHGASTWATRCWRARRRGAGASQRWLARNLVIVPLFERLKLQKFE